MLYHSSISTTKEMTPHNWIVLDIVHHKWHIIYSNEYILLRANMIDRPVMKLTLYGTQHNMLIFATWMDMQPNRGQDAPSRELSWVLKVKQHCVWNNPLLVQLHTLYFFFFFKAFSHYSSASVFNSFENSPGSQSIFLSWDLLSKPELSQSSFKTRKSSISFPSRC